MKKFFVAVAVLIAILVGAFFVLNSYIYNEKQAELDGTYRATLSGEYVCLPSLEQNRLLDECVAGLLSGGEYYAIDLGLMSQGSPQLVEGDMLTANGVVTPIENLNTDYWKQSPVIAIFSVTDSLEISQKTETLKTAAIYRGVLPCASCSGIDTTVSLMAAASTDQDGFYERVEVYQDEEEPFTVTTAGTWEIQNIDDVDFLILTDSNPDADIYRYRIDSSTTIRFAGLDGSALESDLPYDLTLVTAEDTILDKPWSWTYTERSDGSRIEAPSGERFMLTLSSDGRFNSTTDCNGIAGNFVQDGEILSFGPALSTKMYCEGSQESVYTDDLLLTSSYVLRGTILQLNLNRDYGVMYFEAR